MYSKQNKKYYADQTKHIYRPSLAIGPDFCNLYFVHFLCFLCLFPLYFYVYSLGPHWSIHPPDLGSRQNTGIGNHISILRLKTPSI